MAVTGRAGSVRGAPIRGARWVAGGSKPSAAGQDRGRLGRRVATCHVRQVGAGQVHIRQVGAGQVRKRQVGAVQVGTGQVHVAGQGGGEQVDARQVRARQCAVALRQLRDRITVQRSGLRSEPTDQVLGGLNGQSIARRLTAAARAAGIDGRITGHSGRVGLASELTARSASTTETMLAGGWRTARMVAHYSAGAAAEQGAVAKYL